MSCEEDYPEVWKTHVDLCTANHSLEEDLEKVRWQLNQANARADNLQAVLGSLEGQYDKLLDRILGRLGNIYEQ